MYQIRLTNFVKSPESALASTGKQVLCRRGTTFFVSFIRLIVNPDLTIRRNYSNGCLYVDDVTQRCCVPIDDLDEIYSLEEEKEVPQSTAETLKSVFRTHPGAVLEMLDRKDVEAWLKNT